jgi:hypothetical protein
MVPNNTYSVAPAFAQMISSLPRAHLICSLPTGYSNGLMVLDCEFFVLDYAHTEPCLVTVEAVRLILILS